MTNSGRGEGWTIGGRYRVTGRIGSGGMADVFRARDETLQRDVAIKVFRTASAEADTAAGKERQRAELLALAQLNHPHLITLYDGALTDDAAGPSHAYLVMELIEGPTLGDRIDQGPLPSEGETRLIGMQVAEALAYVHNAGMVHRDVKPANILLGVGTGTDTVRARLSDFGIVRLLGTEGMTAVESTLGTATYLAPEQARGSSVGPAADIYALGLTLIEALTGVRSFTGATPIEAAIARLDRDPEIPASLPAPWPALLAAMTTRDPGSRPSAGEVARALRSPADATTGFLPAASAAQGATSMLPRAAAAAPIPIAGARPMPVGDQYPLDNQYPLNPYGDQYEDERDRKRFPLALVVSLLIAAAIIALGIFLIVGTGSDNPSTPTTPASTTPSGRTTAPSSAAPTSDTPTSEAPTSDTPTSEAPTTEAPPTTAPPTTAPPTTQAPTTTAPTTPAPTTPGNPSVPATSAPASP